MDSLEDFGEFLFITALVTLPLVAAIFVRLLTKHPLPRPNAFVFICGALIYGALTICSMLGVLIQFAGSFFGAALAYGHHNRLFEAGLAVKTYAPMVLLPIMVVLSFLVPIRAARSWASLVAAWG